MAQSPQQRQKKLAQNAAKRKQKAALLRQQTAAQPSFATLFQAAVNWPLTDVLMTRDWQDPDRLVQALVSRTSPNGRVAASLFLIDLACLGVKNTRILLYESASEYDRNLRAGIMDSESMVTADVDLIAKILRAGVAYAAQFGFAPHPDYPTAERLLGKTDPDSVNKEVPVGGPDGKPVFIAGPYDNVESILMRLERVAGTDGFDYVVPLEFDPLIELENDEDDDDTLPDIYVPKA